MGSSPVGSELSAFEPVGHGVLSALFPVWPYRPVSQVVPLSDSSACAAWAVRMPPARAAPIANAPTVTARAVRPGSGGPAASRYGFCSAVAKRRVMVDLR